MGGAHRACQQRKAAKQVVTALAPPASSQRQARRDGQCRAGVCASMNSTVTENTGAQVKVVRIMRA